MRYKSTKSIELIDFIDFIDLIDFIDVKDLTDFNDLTDFTGFVDFKDFKDFTEFTEFTNVVNDYNELRRIAIGRFLQRLVGLEASNGPGEGMLRAYEGVPKGRAVWNDQPDPQSFVLDPGEYCGGKRTRYKEGFRELLAYSSG